ncbi:MAG: multiheme c-type cytochrome [Myxococcota bacterium]
MLPDSRARPWPLWLLMIACAGGQGCGGADERPDAGPAVAATPAPALRVVALTDLQGYLEPCGCSENMLGGIDRFAARVAALADEAPTLFVAAGDLFHGPEQHAGPAAEDAERWRREAARDVLAGLGLAATVPGAEDLAHRAELSALLAADPFPLVVAGELPGDDASPLRTQAGVLVAVGELRVGVLGVTSVLAPGPSLAAARAEAERLRSEGAQLLVALVSGDRRLARDVREATGARLVVQGGIGRAEALAPSRDGDGWLLHGGRQGQGVLVADLHRPRSPGDDVDLSAWSMATAGEALDDEIAALERRIAGWRAEGRAGAAVDRQVARHATLKAEREALRPPPFPAEGPAFEARWIALGAEAPKDAAVGRRLRRLDRRINTHNQAAFADRRPPPVPEGEAGYVGSATCRSCHGAAYEWWRGTPHGRAYATLEDLDKEFHLDCVGCHVTGYEEPGGATVTWNRDGALTDVGCESCHGPGSLHVAEPAAHVPPVAPPESLCVGCHNEEHSTAFVFAGYRALLRGPGHGLPSPDAAGSR